jgi:aryl-alcohol dehydrogenase-like predicted oxidoreductase
MELSMPSRPARADAIAVVHAALDAGISLIDTADMYGPTADDPHHNERLIAAALRSAGSAARDVLVATKGGHTRAGAEWLVNGRPDYLVGACERSLRALDRDCIDLYQHHRPDPEVPYEETIGALKDLRDAGKVGLIGISNVDTLQIRAAARVLGVGGLASVQNEFSPRVAGGTAELALCGAMGISFLMYSPLGGLGQSAALRTQHPELNRIADRHGVSPQVATLAWELSLGDHVIAIPGCSRVETVKSCAAAIAFELAEDERAALDAVYRPKPVPLDGSRLPDLLTEARR